MEIVIMFIEELKLFYDYDIFKHFVLKPIIVSVEFRLKMLHLDKDK